MSTVQTCNITLNGGPYDKLLLRVEGPKLPTALLFGDMFGYEDQTIVTAYVVREDSPSQEWNHFIADFSGQCNSQLLPHFLTPPEPPGYEDVL